MIKLEDKNKWPRPEKPGEEHSWTGQLEKSLKMDKNQEDKRKSVLLGDKK